MSRKRRSNCPIHFGLEVFGDRWTLLILRDLLLNRSSTYGDFLHAEEHIATNILANRLGRLEKDGLVTVERGASGRKARRYRPTEKAIDLLPVLMEITVWSATYDPHTAAPPNIVAQIRVNRPGLEQALRQQATTLVAKTEADQTPKPLVRAHEKSQRPFKKRTKTKKETPCPQ